MLKKLSVFSLCLFAVLGMSAVFSGNAKAEENKHRLAVFDFETMIPFQEEDWKVVLPEALMSGLSDSDKITLMEREQLHKILEEQSLGSSDLADPSTQIRLGKIIGVNRMVFGDYMISGTIMKVFVRIVNVETSCMLFSSEVTGTEDDIEDKIIEITPKMLEVLEKSAALGNSVCNTVSYTP